MSNSIRVVIQTQYRENYGAHDWDGEGYPPQHWKAKGGSTYIVSASAADIADSEWWDDVLFAITHSSAYSEEYVISESVVDAIDFVESDHVEEWEEPIYVSHVDRVRGELHCSRESKSFLDLKPVAMNTWIQVSGGGRIDCTYEEYEVAA